MRGRDQILLEEAYNKVNQSNLLESKNLASFELMAKFWDIIAYVAENFAASALDRDHAFSSEVWDWLADLESNPQEMKDFTSQCLDHIRDELRTIEGISWNQQIEHQFKTFFNNVMQTEDPKVTEALSRRDDYTEELNLLINYENLKPETKEVFKDVLGSL